MDRKILKNKPLVEAIFELRWKLEDVKSKAEIVSGPQTFKTDSYFSLLIGSLYEKLKKYYPHYNQLPTASIPEEMAGYIAQHQFRTEEDKWPLVQMGPGVITLNDTDNYVWEDFQKRISFLLDCFFEVYPDIKKDLIFNAVILRYIDSIDFDYEKEDILKFLKDEMKTEVVVYDKLFENTNVVKNPYNVDFKFNYPLKTPAGAITLRFYRGTGDKLNKLIWETQVVALHKDVPQKKEEILKWIESVHQLTDDWFFKIIEGPLLGRFE